MSWRRLIEAYTAAFGKADFPSTPVGFKQRRPLPAGYGKVRHLTPPVVAKSSELQKKGYPIGTQIRLTIGGYDYLFAIEWHAPHKPEERVPDNIKKWHPGCSVYERN